MIEKRPDPDELLDRVRDQERRDRRGKLKVFFGAAPGVGKTYAMLEAARLEASDGKEVVVGIIEHHGRRDTAALLLGLEILPRRKVAASSKGGTFDELDLDAALARKPRLLLVDELAHSNAEGSRHPKRWQDVEELLAAGVDVYTTVNVQHLESLNDVVAQITGIRVRETIPDSIVEGANDVALIDLPPDDLIARLNEGKVYVPAQAQRAIQSFFKKGNLIALRELALRTTAERVDEQMRTYRRSEGIDATWKTGERILVCVSASPLSGRLVRAARRMASSVRAPLIAIYVDTAIARPSEAARAQLEANLKLAEALGAEVVRLVGTRASDETLRFARSRNVSRIVVGKPTHPRWRDALRGSFLDELVRGSGDIDVSVVSGDVDTAEDMRPRTRAQSPSSSPSLRPSSPDEVDAAASARPYFLAALVVMAFSVLARLLVPYLESADIVMIYLVGILLVSTRVGYGPSLVAALLSVLSFDFFCIPPYLTFAVADFRHVITFAVMLLVAVVLTTLTDRVRRHGIAASERERRTGALYAFSRDLASSRGRARLGSSTVSHIEAVFQARATLLMPLADGTLAIPAGLEPRHELDEKEMAVAAWAFSRKQQAGLGTHTLPSSKGLYLPLLASRGTVGVLGVTPASRLPLTQDQRALLETFANQCALAMERALLASEAQRARLRAESEQMRNALLSSVSHDLRTPLASITGAASTLLDEPTRFDPQERDLLATIHEEARRLNRLVSNLLEVTRLESGALALKKDWLPLEEVIGASLNRLDDVLRGRAVTTQIAADLPLVAMDDVLMEQVFTNLIENAAKYTPKGTPIAITARVASPPHEGVAVDVADRGPGIAAGDETRIFDKFHRAGEPGAQRGTGLGLTIARGVVEAHGGRIWAENREGGGALFRFTLPLGGTPPRMPVDEDEAL